MVERLQHNKQNSDKKGEDARAEGDKVQVGTRELTRRWLRTDETIGFIFIMINYLKKYWKNQKLQTLQAAAGNIENIKKLFEKQSKHQLVFHLWRSPNKQEPDTETTILVAKSRG